MGCPGYASYKIDGNGLVEVNGTLPTFPASSDPSKLLFKIWKKYGKAIRFASKKHGVPEAWIVGVIAQESGGNQMACSPCSACAPKYCEEAAGLQCCAFGLMQFIGDTARAYQTSPAAVLADATHAIERGTALLADHLRRRNGDFVETLALYNSGRLQCGAETTFGYSTNHDYPFTVVKYSNTAILSGVVAQGFRKPNPGTIIAALGLVTAAVLYSEQKKD